MAEGPLVFTTIFFLWAITHTDIRAWTLGTASAFAFNSKQSLAALFPVGFIASLWISDPATSLRKRLIAGGQFLIAFIGITLALNPVLWREPVSIVVKSLESRSDLLSTQVEDFGAQNPDLILDRPGEKLLAAIAQVYLLPPSFQEAGNYLENTDRVTHKYLAVPGHNLAEIWRLEDCS